MQARRLGQAWNVGGRLWSSAEWQTEEGQQAGKACRKRAPDVLQLQAPPTLSPSGAARSPPVKHACMGGAREEEQGHVSGAWASQDS